MVRIPGDHYVTAPRYSLLSCYIFREIPRSIGEASNNYVPCTESYLREILILNFVFVCVVIP